jgi:hypothetical protein
VAKTLNPVGSKWIDGCGKLEEHGGASVHSMGNLVEDGVQRSRLSPVRSRSGCNGRTGASPDENRNEDVAS